MKKILVTFLGVVMLLIAGFFWLNSYIYEEKQADVAVPERVTFTGEYLCLPLAEQDVMENGDCAVGIRTEQGEYYAIDLGLMSQGATALIEGDMIKAACIITPIEELSTDYWKKYPVVGIFSVTDSLEIIESEKQELLASYEGTLPCPSCESIGTKLELFSSSLTASSGSYILTEVFKGQEGSDPVVTKGKWQLTEKGESAIYELQTKDGVRLYAVQDEQMIRQLKSDGTDHPSELPYNLKKIGTTVSTILDTPWLWLQTQKLDGTKVVPAKADAFVLVFHTDGRYTSTTDCNSLGGDFTIDQEVLSLSPAISTKMFCEGSQESTYMQDLMLTNSYTIEGEALTLNLNRDYGLMKFIRNDR